MVDFKATRQLNSFEDTSVNDVLVCPECGSTNITKDYHTYELLCECGCVVDEEMIDYTPDTRGSDINGRSRSHIGGAKRENLHDGGLSTNISWPNRNMSHDNRIKFNRLRKLHNRNRVNGWRERHLAMAFNTLSTYVSVLSLPKSVSDSSARYYKKAYSLGLIHGRGIDKMMISCVYLSCRMLGIPRTSKELAEASGVKRKAIDDCYRLLKKELKVKPRLSKPGDYVPRFASNLQLSREVEVEAFEIINLSISSLGSQKPDSVAAASLYIAARKLGVRKTQGEVHKACEVSETTIRKICKAINAIMA